MVKSHIIDWKNFSQDYTLMKLFSNIHTKHQFLKLKKEFTPVLCYEQKAFWNKYVLNIFGNKQ